MESVLRQESLSFRPDFFQQSSPIILCAQTTVVQGIMRILTESYITNDNMLPPTTQPHVVTAVIVNESTLVVGLIAFARPDPFGMRHLLASYSQHRVESVDAPDNTQKQAKPTL